MFSANKLQSYEEFSAATGVIIPMNSTYTDFYNKYIGNFNFDVTTVDLSAWNVDASPILYYLFISYLKDGKLVY